MDSFNMQRFDAKGQAFEIDPVCKMEVDPQNPPFKILHKGKSYYFCAEVCKRLFERAPENYIKTDEMVSIKIHLPPITSPQEK